MMQRLPQDAETEAEVFQYYVTRAKQMAQDGVTWSAQIHPLEDYGFRTFFVRHGVQYQSVYILKQHRGQGKLKQALTGQWPFITVRDCGVIGIFQRYNVPYYEVEGVLNTAEYQAIQQEYGDQRAQRSQVFLMNHIDEGQIILSAIGASDAARRAYCLHPLLQNDQDLALNYRRVADAMPAYHVMLAMEYRSVANEYLSARVGTVDRIRLSPIGDVNDMLRADKVQNYKDFITHHRASHPRSSELDRYFRDWLAALNIGQDMFDNLCRIIDGGRM